MEVQTVSNLHSTTALLTSLHATDTKASATTQHQQKQQQEQHQAEAALIKQLSKTNKSNNETKTKEARAAVITTTSPTHDTLIATEAPSRSNSPVSSNNSDINDKELHELDLNGSLTTSGVSVCKSNGSLSGASTNSNNLTVATTAATGNGSATTAGMTQIKKRISSSRTPTRKARRIKFYRNGDRFYPGITIPVSNERYRSFDSLFEDITRLLEENVKIPGAVRTIYTMCGKKISALDELEDGQSYVCSCNNENFKKVEYNMTSQPLANLTLSNKTNTRVTKIYRPASPLKNGANNAIQNPAFSGGGGGLNGGGSPLNTSRLRERDSPVFPRIITLVRNGTRPRKIMRLLLNKRNSPSFDHVLTAITQVVQLDTGYVRKVYTESGLPAQQLVDFFMAEDVFFVYGTERVNNPEDFKLEPDEQKAINAIRKTLRTSGTTCKGPKPKMPVKSKKVFIGNTNAETDELFINSSNGTILEETVINESGINTGVLPNIIRENYALGQIIGDGNFAIVLKIKDRQTQLPYALKIIDKSKCKGKEHYIDAEVRVMKKLHHPHIISLILDVDQAANMYLVLEYVSGGDLFDAITRVTRFSEKQSRTMMRHLGSAMSYLHSMGIVHRDIKPENLLVQLDKHGNVIQLKLADFGLACEVTEPLYAVCGTPTYVAPEILLEVGYGLKIDVWAAGIILYILLCGFPPFVAPDNQQEPLFDAIITGVYEFPDPYWSDIGDGVRDLIANMLQSDPDVRFTSEDILDHYWTMGNDDDEDDVDEIDVADDYNR